MNDEKTLKIKYEKKGALAVLEGIISIREQYKKDWEFSFNLMKWCNELTVIMKSSEVENER